MDIAGLKNVFQTSLPRYNVRYINFLGDGDLEAFGAMEYLKTYSNYVTISKLEYVCIPYAERHGINLHQLKLFVKKI
jgi:hypothetical protein